MMTVTLFWGHKLLFVADCVSKVFAHIELKWSETNLS